MRSYTESDCGVTDNEYIKVYRCFKSYFQEMNGFNSAIMWLNAGKINSFFYVNTEWLISSGRFGIKPFLFVCWSVLILCAGIWRLKKHSSRTVIAIKLQTDVKTYLADHWSYFTSCFFSVFGDIMQWHTWLLCLASYKHLSHGSLWT